jgi:hypothetical protein
MLGAGALNLLRDGFGMSVINESLQISSSPGRKLVMSTSGSIFLSTVRCHADERHQECLWNVVAHAEEERW